ncbi:MAG: hypothetical protein ACLPWF_30090 [Bryobacteraceae bacterium]|jgi:hypothetical protein
MNTTPFQIACEKLKALGLVLQQAPGHYRVNFRNGTTDTEYQTEDLDDALQRGCTMAAHPPPPPDPPLGPTGTRLTRRAVITRHNRAYVARLAKERSAKEKS